MSTTPNECHYCTQPSEMEDGISGEVVRTQVYCRTAGDGQKCEFISVCGNACR